MYIWSPTYQQSIFERYHSDKHFSEFLPTRWRQKSTGIDMEQNYVTVTLCMVIFITLKIQKPAQIGAFSFHITGVIFPGVVIRTEQSWPVWELGPVQSEEWPCMTMGKKARSQIKYTTAFLSNSTQKLLWFKITEMLNCSLRKILSFIVPVCIYIWKGVLLRCRVPLRRVIGRRGEKVA